MSADYTPLFLFILIAIAIGLSMLIMSALLGPRKKTAIKQMPYESGMDPIGDARQRFDVRYYLVAIVFLLFDVELLFLYPFAVAQWSATPSTVSALASVYPDLGVAGIPDAFRWIVFWEILVFIVVLSAALVYAWKKGVFEWR